jgi:hypothetical protein
MTHLKISSGWSERRLPRSAQEFQQLLDTSVKELQFKNDAHQSWGLGKFNRWDLDQDTGTLVISNPDNGPQRSSASMLHSIPRTIGRCQLQCREDLPDRTQVIRRVGGAGKCAGSADVVPSGARFGHLPPGFGLAS